MIRIRKHCTFFLSWHRHGLLVLSLLMVTSCQSPRAFLQQAQEDFVEDAGWRRGPHRVAVLDAGSTALLERIDLIRTARVSVDIQTFIWSNDSVGRLLMDELVQAARRGVRVRILVDQMFSHSNPAHVARLLAEAPGLQIRLYNPPTAHLDPSAARMMLTALHNWDSVNRRMHNKLMVVDDSVAICGGRNIAAEYFDLDPDFCFRDRDVLIQGPAVADMVSSFDRYWQTPLSVDLSSMRDVAGIEQPGPWPDSTELDIDALRERLDMQLTVPVLRASYTTIDEVAFWADDPGPDHKAAARLAVLLAAQILEARSSVCVQTPYLVMSRRATACFESVRSRGVDLCFMTNSLAATDNWPTWGAGLRQRRLLLQEWQAQVYEFRPHPRDRARMQPVPPLQEDGSMARPRLCLHSKSMVVDERVAVIGSYNLDPRSGDTNTELAIAMRDPDITTVIRASMAADARSGNSWVVAAYRRPVPLHVVHETISVVSRLVGNLTSLELWPMRSTSCFELHVGAQEVPASHPEFYQRYEAVGVFPELSPGHGKRIKARLIKAFGGVIMPIL